MIPIVLRLQGTVSNLRFPCQMILDDNPGTYFCWWHHNFQTPNLKSFTKINGFRTIPPEVCDRISVVVHKDLISEHLYPFPNIISCLRGKITVRRNHYQFGSVAESCLQSAGALTQFGPLGSERPSMIL